MRLYHSRTQRAVGQGGFHTGLLDDGFAVFRYAYDCGSNNARRLAVAIRDLRDESEALDVLFLSHLDMDHANGCDALLDAMAVETVVLPYLSPFERLVLVAEVAAAPPGATSTATAIDFLSRPADWFLERGAKRVVFVRGRRPDDGEPRNTEPGAEPPPRHPPEDAEMTLTKTAVEHPGHEERAALGASGREPGDDVLVTPSAPMLVTKSDVPFWELTPFVHPELFRAPIFQKAVARLLGFRKVPPDEATSWLSRLKATVADRSKRGDLAKLYNEHIRRDRNLSSMTLYSGPIVPAGAQVTAIQGISRYYFRPPHTAPLGSVKIGWVGTGDAHLDRDSRREAFERFYGQRLGKVSTMMLPHHGSRHNLRPLFLQTRPGLTWIAAFGTDNTYHHPDPHLMLVASTYGDAVSVTERRRTEFVQSIALDWPTPPKPSRP